jgi:transposase-like protein
LTCPMCGSEHEYVRLAEDRSQTIKYKCGSFNSRERILQSRQCEHWSGLEASVKVLEEFVSSVVAGADIAAAASLLIRKRQAMSDLSFSTPSGVRYAVEAYHEDAV